ncbi:hypothetical protein Pmani_034135 [Petrolisthes manimaculis]|uniref:Uncharacterized protein n=1 Tax=Petrolisthes manimaculis TaxID=1843537 RepID=A0AAE1TPR3_9EUCA|nr:hypothetical protein Pmani_034135 [Petrolisthes manimaculis]
MEMDRVKEKKRSGWEEGKRSGGWKGGREKEWKVDGVRRRAKESVRPGGGGGGGFGSSDVAPPKIPNQFH